MLTRDLVRLSFSSIVAHRLRSLLTVLGISVGIGAVVLLTSIGEGIHKFVLSEFTQFGTNLIAVNPGKATTLGTPLGIMGTVRPLSINDAEALKRVPRVRAVVPAVWGNAEVKAAGKSRRTTVYGMGPAMPEAFSMKVQLGRFLPADDPQSPRAFAVLGSKLRAELFGAQNPLGKKIRVGGERYRVIGVMASKGQILGMDLDDTVFLPAARTLDLFNRDSLMEVDLVYEEGADLDEVVAGIKRILLSRHGREDFTITTQQQMMDVLGNVLNVLTFAVGALGSISLLVGGIGILTIMTIAVKERTSEIGLLRALGAERGQILLLFLGEAAVLAAIGGIAGLALGVGGAQLLTLAVPALPVHTPWSYVLAAEVVAILIGFAAGVLPARQAAAMDPVEALRTE
ncbi:MAG TPA: FtsX-like permease family protein [Gammaproteobacteria bacterium]|nr:FtsX-like permease family protein [Gammaproteobacteria bacterium]